MQRYRNTPEMQLKKTFYCFRTHLKYKKKQGNAPLCSETRRGVAIPELKKHR